MVWATPSIFKHSVYPSDVIIRPINALKAFSSLDNELLSKQPCRAISAYRLIWSHKGLMLWGAGVGAMAWISGSHGLELQHLLWTSHGQCFSRPRKCWMHFPISVICMCCSLPRSQFAQLHQPGTCDAPDPEDPTEDIGAARHSGENVQRKKALLEASTWPSLKVLPSQMVFELQETPFLLQIPSFSWGYSNY